MDLRFLHLGVGDDLPARLVPYEEGLTLQRSVHADVVAGERPSTVVLLEHPDVYTAGRSTSAWERPLDGTPVVDVDRGGKITWHGPGQLVGYPIVALAVPLDVVSYVRRLEQVLIDTCAEFGVATGRVTGRTGVWLPATSSQPERKIAAIGVRVSRRVTMHGFALNLHPDLAAFSRIVPCGITDAGVTSLSAELGRRVGIAEVLPVIEGHLAAADLPGRSQARKARTDPGEVGPGVSAHAEAQGEAHALAAGA
ncbi:MAG: lipoyl(octanoyl) transferase LipB [Kineosporiaceae bacterium]